MTSKSLLISIAAFALAMTSVGSFTPDVLANAGLSLEQISAFEEARELREEGDTDEARDVLLHAGIDLETIEKIRKAAHERQMGNRTLIQDAVEMNDFDLFQTAITGSPLDDIVTTEADFRLFREAHQLRLAGQLEEAEAIMKDLLD